MPMKPWQSPDQRNGISTPPAMIGPPGMVGSVGEITPKSRPNVKRECGVDEDRHDKRAELKTAELIVLLAADARKHDAGQQIDGKPDPMIAQDAIGQGRDRHQQAAHDAAFDTGGNRVER